MAYITQLLFSGYTSELLQKCCEVGAIANETIQAKTKFERDAMTAGIKLKL
jgi:hypothetical protein